MTAAVTHHRPGRKATRPPVTVAPPSPLFRFVRPWWSTSWAAPLWTGPAVGAMTWAAAVWPVVGTWCAVVALVALAVLARRPLTRHGCRAIGALCAVVAAVLAASTSTAVGPWAGLIVVAGAALAAWPWLPMRTLAARRARVRTIRAAWPSVVEVTGLPTGTALEGVEPTARGWRLGVRAPRGADAGTIAHAARRIGSAVGRGAVAVDLDATDAGRAVVRVTEGADPLTGPPRPRPADEVATVADGAPFGLDENGRAVVLPLVESSALIGGRPGAGKSVGLSLIAAAAVEAPDAVLWAVDLKGGVELGPWLPATTRAATTSAAAGDLFTALDELMTARLSRLALDGARKLVPTVDEPLIVLLVDEVAELEKEQLAQLRRLVSLGRAPGISVWAATQRPSADLIPTSLRGLFRFAIGFPIKRRRDSDVILGDGWAADGVDASTLKAPGQAWAILDDGAVRCRSWLMTDADIGRTVARHAGHTVHHEYTAHRAPMTGDDRTPPPSNDAPAAGADTVRPLAAVPEPAPDPVALARHPGWSCAGTYAHAMHTHLLTCTDSAAGTARAVGASDRTARRTLPQLEAAGLVELRGGRWCAVPATLDALEALEGRTVEGAA
mgnify:CR=1 FL=1|jgi:S-DNA-T family DNA segregation ATPase FtsK/SpoIIIE